MTDSTGPRPARALLGGLFRLASLLSLLALGASAAHAQETGALVGLVVDARSKASLAGAQVVHVASGTVTSTARDGSFTFRRLSLGEHVVRVTHLGYEARTATTTVTAGAEARLVIELGGDVVELEEFQVDGFAGGQAAALQQQRALPNLADIVAADAIGRFPDATIADAVRRLPGVTIERESGDSEGRYVTIRGMNADFNAVSVNGQRVTISNDDGTSRSVPLDVVPTASAASIRVTKALTPDMDADGIGGAIEITTRSVFDRGTGFLAADVGVGHSEALELYDNYPYENPSLRGGFTWGDFLGDDQKLALVLSGSFRNQPFAIQQGGTTGYWDKDLALDRVRNPVDNQYYFIPRGFVLQEFFEEVDNLGLNGRLEYRPSDDTELSLSVNATRRDSQRGRQRQVVDYRFNRVDGAASAAFPVVVQGDTFVQFTTTNSSRLERQARDFAEQHELLNVVAEGERRFGDLVVSGSLGTNHGTFEGDDSDLIATYRWGDDLGEFRSSRNGYSIVGRDPNLPAFSTTRDRMAPDEFVLTSLDRSTLDITDEEFSANLDFQLDRDFGGHSGFLKFGAKARLRERDSNSYDRFYTPNLSRVYWTADFIEVDGVEVFGSTVADYSASSSVDGNYQYGYFLDPVRIREAQAVLQAREGATPGSLLVPAADSAIRNRVNSYDASEDIWSTYGMAQVQVGRAVFLAGLRAELTDVVFDTTTAINQGGTYVNPTPIRGTNDYIDVLPNLQVRFEASEDLVLRASFTQTIARASYRQLNPTSLLVTSPDDSDIPTLTLGRTDLDPVLSNNFDVSAQWYFGGVGQLGVAFFYKDMQDNVYRLRQTITDPVYGPVEVREFRNAEGAKVYGVELSYDQQFRSLPGLLGGLGVFANLTVGESEADIALPERVGIKTPLFGQTDTSANLGLFFEKHGIEARLAWNWRDAYLTFSGLNRNPALDQYLDEHGQLDFTTSYTFRNGLSVFAEFLNLTNEEERSYQGNAALRPSYIEYRDWSALIGLRWSR